MDTGYFLSAGEVTGTIIQPLSITDSIGRENDVHVTVHRDKRLIIKPTRCTNF